MYDVAFYEVFEEEEYHLKKFLNKKVNAFFTEKTIQEYSEDNICSHLISIRTKSYIPHNWQNNIKGILTRTTGYNHLLEYKNVIKQNVSYGYIPSYCSRSVAEHTLMLIMVLLKRFKSQIIEFASFNSDRFTGQDCSNKNILIAGIGHIGFELAKICKSLQMNVYGYDKNQRHKEIVYVDIDSGIKDADIIVCAMAHNKGNIAFFNYDLLRKAKKGSFFINISRGEISPIHDLAILLKEKHLAGIAMDVFENEKELSSELLDHGRTVHSEQTKLIRELAKQDNVIFTPHNAFNTLESIENKSKQSIEQIHSFIKSNSFIWNIANQ